MNAPPRHLVALVIAGNLMGCQLIKKFTDRHHDSGVATGTVVVALDGGSVALPTVAAYDAGAAANAAIAAANQAMANAADASAQANAAMANAMGDASAAMAAAPTTAEPAAPAPAAPEPAAPPPVAPAAPTAVAPTAAAPTAPAAEPDREGHHAHHGDFCGRHPGELNPRTGQICPNALGSQNLMH